MDDLVGHAVAEPALDLRRLGAAQELHLAGVEADDAPGELVTLGVAEPDAVAGVERPLHLHHARRKQARAALDERAPGPQVHVENALGGEGETDPALAGGEAV